MSGYFDVGDGEAFFEAREDGLQQLGTVERDLPAEGVPDEQGWNTCECGRRTPNVGCVPCGVRLRPPGSAGEIRWMRNHGFAPTLRDLNRLGVE